MDIKIKGLIAFFCLVSLTVSVSAVSTHVNWYEVLSGYTGYVNQSGNLRMDTTYTWGLNVSGNNVTAVSVNGVALSNTSDLSTGTADWRVDLMTPSVAAFEDNCTYTSFTFTITNYNESGDVFTNTTVQNNVTVLPCIETSTVTADMTVTDMNDTSVDLTDSLDSDTLLWLKGLYGNATNQTCQYGCSNTELCVVPKFVIGGLYETEYCQLYINRSSGESGDVVLSSDDSLGLTAPTNIPAAVGLTLTILVAVGVVSRIKRRGSKKEA